MSNEIDINDYVIQPDEEIEIGDELRVRPWSPPARVYGQGENTGPQLGDVKLEWGEPWTVTKTGKIQKELVERNRQTFMREKEYQNYQSQLNNS